MKKQNRKLFKNDNKSYYSNKTSNRKDKGINSRQNFNKKNNKLDNTENQVLITASYKVNRSSELLEFLLTKCNTSRNNVKELLTSKKVLVNGSVISQYNFMLAKDDEVKISKHAVQSKIIKEPKKTSIHKLRLPFKIIYEDDDFIAIDKPYGLLSVESDNDRTCAFSYLLNYFQQQSKIYRPYLLHRIDKETSGVLVFAKNIKLHSMLKMNWNNLVKTREYIAIVEGIPEKEKDTIISYLKENKNNMVYSTRDITGQKAITNYTIINSNEEYSMLRVTIDTGRKNQIRVHMQDRKHPIVGDVKYGHTKNPLNRLGLHASKLEFTHPITKDIISISAPIPDTFRKLFNHFF